MIVITQEWARNDLIRQSLGTQHLATSFPPIQSEPAFAAGLFGPLSQSPDASAACLVIEQHQLEYFCLPDEVPDVILVQEAYYQIHLCAPLAQVCSVE